MKWCSLYEGCNDAKGYSWLGAGRGMLSMANIFLNQSFLQLAYDQAGCELGNGGCDAKVYGFSPSSWLTNVPIIAGLASAFLMPLCGAIVDFTDYRRALGIWTAVVIVVIQGIQIGTVASTWFAMMMLQAVAVVFYFMQLVAAYAYLPDVAREVGEKKMAKFTSYFQIIQFGNQALFLIIIAIISIAIKPTAVMTGQISQGLNTLSSAIFFSVGWFKYFEHRDAVRKLPEGHSMVTEGFKNNWETIKNIQMHFKKGLRWFFLALAFSQAAAQAVTTVSVVYLSDTLALGSLDTSIFFLIVLVVSLPGCALGGKLSRMLNPNTSYKVGMLYIFICLTAGALTLETAPKYCAFIWAAFVGIGLGWFYATEPLFFSMILPVGQEAELAGFYNFVSQVIAWLPPTVFTVATEKGVAQKHCIVITASFFLVAIALLMCTGTWDEILEEARTGIVENAVASPKSHGGDAEEFDFEGKKDGEEKPKEDGTQEQSKTTPAE